jgi:hypothetical protein
MSGVPTVLTSIERFPPSSTPLAARPATTTSPVDSSFMWYVTSSPSVINARSSDAAEEPGRRSSIHAAPGPWIDGQRPARHTANCSAVVSEKPTTCFGSPRRSPSTIRCTP